MYLGTCYKHVEFLMMEEITSEFMARGGFCVASCVRPTLFFCIKPPFEFESLRCVLFCPDSAPKDKHDEILAHGCGDNAGGGSRGDSGGS